MRALVIGTPKFQIPPDQLLAVADGAISWYERYQDKFESFGSFRAAAVSASSRSQTKRS
jgi:hypothetical protein